MDGACVAVPRSSGGPCLDSPSVSVPPLVRASIESGATTPSTRSRLLRRAALAMGVGLLLPFVPLPGLEFSTRSVGATADLPAPAPIGVDELAAAQAAADELGLTYEIGKVTDIAEIIKYGVMSTPALVVDGQVKSAGKLLSPGEIKKLLGG